MTKTSQIQQVKSNTSTSQIQFKNKSNISVWTGFSSFISFNFISSSFLLFRFCLLCFVCPVLSCPVLSYHTPSYPILSYVILSYPVLSSPQLSYPVLSCPILSHLILSYPTLSYPIPSRPIPSYPILSCPILSCPILQYPILSCPVLSHIVSFVWVRCVPLYPSFCFCISSFLWLPSVSNLYLNHLWLYMVISREIPLVFALQHDMIKLVVYLVCHMSTIYFCLQLSLQCDSLFHNFVF